MYNVNVHPCTNNVQGNSKRSKNFFKSLNLVKIPQKIIFSTRNEHTILRAFFFLGQKQAKVKCRLEWMGYGSDRLPRRSGEVLNYFSAGGFGFVALCCTCKVQKSRFSGENKIPWILVSEADGGKRWDWKGRWDKGWLWWWRDGLDW